MNSIQGAYNPYNLNSYRVVLDEDTIKSVKSPEYVTNKTEKKNAKKAVVLISSITGGLTLLVTGIALLRRGNGAGVENLKKSIDKVISNFEGKESLSKLDKKIVEFIKKQKGKLDKLSSINNFASVKDVPVCRGLSKVKPGKKFCDFITNIFGKMTHNTLTNSYQKAEKSFAEVFESLRKFDAKTIASKNPNEVLEINGVKKTVEEWLKMSSECQASIQQNIQDGFSVTAHTSRFSRLKESLSTIKEEFWNRLFKGKEGQKTVKEAVQDMSEKAKQSAKELSETFVLEDLASPRKIDYVTEVYKHKSAITNTFSDRCEQALDVMQCIKIDSADAKTYREMLKNISGNLKNLAKNKGQNSEALIEEITTQSNELVEMLSKSTDVANKDKLIGIIKSNIENLTNEAQKGKLQQLLEIQRGLLAPAEYAELEKSINSAASKLNKSARLESGDFFDKIRDISSGSAVTDVLFTGFAPILGTTAAMVRADSKQERRSTLLKTGIPLLGGVAVSLGCTAGIVPIGISLALGLGSSFVLNRIGKAVNEKIAEKEMIDELNQKTETQANVQA